MLINGKDPTRAAAFGALVLVLAAAFLWVLWALRIVVLIAFGACCLASAFSPIVSRLERLRVPRIAAIALVYITVFALIPWILFMIMAPPIQEEARRVSEVLPGLITQVQDKMAAFSDDAKRYGINISLNEASPGGLRASAHSCFACRAAYLPSARGWRQPSSSPSAGSRPSHGASRSSSRCSPRGISQSPCRSSRR